MTLKALIFDVDGTLAETEELHRRAFNEAFVAAGLDWHWDEELYGKLLKVAGGKERLTHYIELTDPERAAQPDCWDFVVQLHAQKTKIYTDLMAKGEIKLRPGITRLVKEAARAGLKLAISTTTSPANVAALLDATMEPEDRDLFKVISCGDRAKSKKPAPDVYLNALQDLGLSADECLAFEDSSIGLTSAQAANIPTLITVARYTQDQSFTGALAVISDLGEPYQPFTQLAGDPCVPSYIDLNALTCMARSHRRVVNM